MTTKRALLVAGLSLVLGAAIGYVVAQKEFAVLSADIDAARLANQFNYRLSLLRLLRYYHAKPKEVQMIEIETLVLVDNIDVKKTRPGSSSRFVLEETAKRLAAYRADFPNSEFNPQRSPIVAHILSLGAIGNDTR